VRVGMEATGYSRWFERLLAALRVYRKGDSSDRMQDGTVKGVLVRDIKLEELWPEI
jgi:transposase